MIDISEQVELMYNNFGNSLIKVKGKFLDDSTDLGYCTKGNYYYIYTGATGSDEVDERILMHEYGHIYLGHLDGIHEELDSRLMKVIEDNREYLEDLINESCKIDYADKLLDRVVNDDYLNHKLHNIAMDMEVNSSVLNLDDIELIESYLDSIMPDDPSINLLNYISDKVDDEESRKELSDLIDRIKKMGKVKLIHPSREGFSEGLTYPDYLIQIVLNLDKFIKFMVKVSLGKGSGEDVSDEEMQNSIGSGMGAFDEMMEKSENSNGTGSSGGDKSNESDTDPKGKNGKDSKDNSGKGSGEDEDKSDEKNGSKNDHRTKSRDVADNKRHLGEIVMEGSRSKGVGGSDATRSFTVNNDPLVMGLEEILKEYKHKVLKLDFRRDVAYKYNRRIVDDVISPSYRQKITKSEDPKVVFVLDCSRSMDTRLIDRILTFIKIRMKKINRNSKYDIISWDTELCEHYRDLTASSPIPKISCGGGTELAESFDYFKEQYGKEAIMVLISDFYDSLERWNDKERTMTGYSLYGFNYGQRRDDIPFKNFKVKYCGNSDY